MLRRSVLEFCALGWLTAVCPLRPAQAAQKTVSRMVRPFNLKEKTVKLNNGRTMPVLGLGTYALHGQTCVRAVPGSSNPAHIKENTEIFDLELSDSDMKAIVALDRHEKHEWY